MLSIIQSWKLNIQTIALVLTIFSQSNISLSNFKRYLDNYVFKIEKANICLWQSDEVYDGKTNTWSGLKVLFC